MNVSVSEDKGSKLLQNASACQTCVISQHAVSYVPLNCDEEEEENVRNKTPHRVGSRHLLHVSTRLSC